MHWHTIHHGWWSSSIWHNRWEKEKVDMRNATRIVELKAPSITVRVKRLSFGITLTLSKASLWQILFIPPYFVSKSLASIPRTQVPFPTKINCRKSHHCVRRINNSSHNHLSSWFVLRLRGPKEGSCCPHTVWLHCLLVWEVALVLLAFSCFLRDLAYLESFTAGSNGPSKSC